MSLVVWLPFNNSTNNQGTSTCNLGSGSPSYSTGKVTRYCLNSGGWVDYKSSNLVIPMTTTGTFSMGAWIKNKDTSVSTNAWVFVIGEGDNVCKGLWNGTGHTTSLHWAYSSQGQNISCSINTQDGNWHHIFFVNDKPNGTCTLWVDGQKQGSITLNSNGLNACTRELVKVNSTYYAVNDFRIYNHCLSAKEIKELSRGLALHYKFNFEDFYVPVEYIQGTGTQYIDTGFVDTPNTKVEIDMQFTSTSPVQQRLFGHGYDSDTGSNVSFEAYINGATQWARATSNGTGNWQTTSVSANTSRHRFVLDNTRYIVYNADGSIAYNDVNNSTITRTNTANIYLMNRSNQDSDSFRARAKLYGCKIWDNDRLVRNFIPCVRKCDSVAGLFDLVNGVFYTNAGSGTFTIPSTSYTSSIPDASGYNNAITPTSVTASNTTNIGTQAVSFTGSSSYLRLAHEVLNGAFSVSVWFKTSSTSNQCLFCDRASTGGGPALFLLSGNSVRFDTVDTNCSASLSYGDGNWHHIVAVYNGSNRYIYIDGTLKTTYATTSLGGLGAVVSIGGSYASSSATTPNGNYFNGQISDWRLYNTALSQADITELYKTKESIDKKGNLYCNTINELGNSMSFKKNSVIECNSITEGFNKTSLQGVYTQLEYIKTNGNQIINTGVADTLRTTVDLDMQVDSGIGQYWYGSTQNSGSMMYNGLYNITALEYNWLTISRTSNNRCIMTQRLNGNNIVITMNGVTSTVSVGSTAPTGNLYIFGCNNGSRYYGTGILCRYFKIYQDNVLVRDFIPVKRNTDSAIGMLDLVHNTFYANSGTGSFTAGNEINKKYAIYTNNIIEN